MNTRLEQDLLKLKHKLREMAALTQEAINFAIDDFVLGTDTHYKEIKEIEGSVNRLEQELESDCIRFIIQQQPVAKDLRNVSSLLKMITDIERISDQACDISHLTKTTNANYAPKPGNIIKMAHLSKKMLEQAITAVISRDLELAKNIIELDEQVDNLYITVKNDIINHIKNNHCDEDKVIDILIVAKYLERIADHSTNISEWIIFYLTGHHE